MLPGLATGARAESSPQQRVQYQHQVRASPFDQRYRSGRNESAQQILDLPADSLGQLLTYVRRAQELRASPRPGPATRYLEQAWRLAGPRQRQQQPAVILELADALAGRYYAQGAYDSTFYYYQQAAQMFRAAGFDSTQQFTAAARSSGPRRPNGVRLAGILANTGSACRALGRLPLPA